MYRLSDTDPWVSLNGDDRHEYPLCIYDGLMQPYQAGTTVELYLVDGKPNTIWGMCREDSKFREYTAGSAIECSGQVGGFFPSDALGPISARD